MKKFYFVHKNWEARLLFLVMIGIFACAIDKPAALAPHILAVVVVISIVASSGLWYAQKKRQMVWIN